MKHPILALQSPASLHRFGFTYRERKIGIYLWLWYPLRWSGDGTHCWRTNFEFMPRGECTLERITWRTHANGSRRVRGYRSQFDYALLWLNFEPYGHPEKMLLDLDGEPDRPIDIDAFVFHTKVRAFITGCVEAGHFEPFADWFCEEFPALAFLFLEPGKVNLS